MITSDIKKKKNIPRHTKEIKEKLNAIEVWRRRMLSLARSERKANGDVIRTSEEEIEFLKNRKRRRPGI